MSEGAQGLPVHLRHAVALLAAEDLPCDFARLADDLARWLDPWQDEARDRVRQRWAREFYRQLAEGDDDDTPHDNPTMTEESRP